MISPLLNFEFRRKVYIHARICDTLFPWKLLENTLLEENKLFFLFRNNLSLIVFVILLGFLYFWSLISFRRHEQIWMLYCCKPCLIVWVWITIIINGMKAHFWEIVNSVKGCTISWIRRSQNVKKGCRCISNDFNFMVIVMVCNEIRKSKCLAIKYIRI